MKNLQLIVGILATFSLLFFTECDSQLHETDVSVEANISLTPLNSFTPDLTPISYNRSPSLEEATGMDLQEFYSTFRDPNTQSCIQAQGLFADRFP